MKKIILGMMLLATPALAKSTVTPAVMKATQARDAIKAEMAVLKVKLAEANAALARAKFEAAK